MNLKEALIACMNGAKIRYKGWGSQDGESLDVYDSTDYVEFRDNWFKMGEHSWSPREFVVLSDDWEIVKEPKIHQVELWTVPGWKPNSTASDLSGFLFGDGWSHSNDNLDMQMQKVRITVEEIEE
jgi:hypothetical protein